MVEEEDKTGIEKSLNSLVMEKMFYG